MEFSFYKWHFSIKNKDKTIKFDAEDFNSLHSEALRYIEKLPKEEIEKRLSSVTLNKSDFDLAAAKEILAKSGILIVKDFVSPDELGSLSASFEGLLSLIGDFKNSNDSFEEKEGYLIQNGPAKISGYGNLAGYLKPVINIRDGHDSGMVDVFNVDHLIPEFNEHIKPHFEDATLKSLLDRKSESLSAKNLNVYINESITGTRGFHVDSYGEQIKAFLYLSDVNELNDGPYVYVKKTHLETVYRKINKKIAGGVVKKTESPIVDHENILPVLAKKGALIISDQGGIHRGHPQSESGKRYVAVMNYKKTKPV